MSIDVANAAMRYIGVGIVAAAKGDNSDVIEAMPFERLPFVEGKIHNQLMPGEKTGKDADGVHYLVKLDLSMCVIATWLKEANVWSAPNVAVGETVDLYCIGDTELYYWAERGEKTHLRRTEKLVMAWAASGESTPGPIKQSADNHYCLYVDTESGHLTIRTSADRGEPKRLTVQINTKAGIITATDNDETNLSLNFVDEILQMQTKSGGVLGVNKATVFAKGKLLTADFDTATLEVKDLTLKGDSLTFTIPNMVFTGNSVFNGDVGVNGSFAMTGDGDSTATFGGEVTFDAIVTFKKKVSGPEAYFKKLECETLDGKPIAAAFIDT